MISFDLNTLREVLKIGNEIPKSNICNFSIQLEAFTILSKDLFVYS